MINAHSLTCFFVCFLYDIGCFVTPRGTIKIIYIQESSMNLKNSTPNNSKIDCTTQICFRNYNMNLQHESEQNLITKEDEIEEGYGEMLTPIERNGMKAVNLDFEVDKYPSTHEKKYTLFSENQEYSSNCNNIANGNITYHISNNDIKIIEVNLERKFIRLQNKSDKEIDLND